MSAHPDALGLPVERRHGRRPSCRIPGLLIAGTSAAPLSCDVVDLDATGAHIRLRKAPVMLPVSLRLLLPGSAVVYDATLAWRRGGDCGLAIAGRHDLAEACPPDLTPLLTLCAAGSAG